MRGWGEVVQGDWRSQNNEGQGTGRGLKASRPEGASRGNWDGCATRRDGVTVVDGWGGGGGMGDTHFWTSRFLFLSF